ncbi:MAG: potassium channel family protein [Pseudomonadota bacterium]
MAGFIPHVDERNNFIVLLTALVFFLAGDAIAVQFQLQNAHSVVNTLLLITLVVNVWAVHNPRTDLISWKLGASMVIVMIMVGDLFVQSLTLTRFQLLIAFLFICLTIWQAWSQVMFTGVVDRNKIVGAICIYLLLGVAWAFAYLIADSFIPGSMTGLDSGIWQEKVHSLVYYSMVTLTTLGYGEITPAQPLTRFLAFMEAITGIFYTTVLVASLIGIRLSGVDRTRRIEELGQESRSAQASDEAS